MKIGYGQHNGLLNIYYMNYRYARMTLRMLLIYMDVNVACMKT